MFDLFSKYLALHRHASIPGVGAFAIAHEPAILDEAAQIIYPPVSKVVYTPGTALTDKHFYDFLAAELSINEVEAIRKFQDFAYDLKNKINHQSKVDVRGLGVLYKNSLGEISFDNEESAEYFTPIHLEQLNVIADTESDEQSTIEAYEEEVPAKDQWWLWALLLGLVGVGALIYYYYTNQR